MKRATSIEVSPGMLDRALALAAHGFEVIPLIEGSKLPLVPGWPEKATTDADQVRRWWTDPVMGWEQQHNIGIATGRYRDGALLVVDVDMKDGKNGAAALKALEAAHGALPATRRVDTPTGGWHLYFRTDTPVGTSAGVLGTGVDVRGAGGFVVAPGSVVAAGVYRLSADDPIADAPEWLLALCPPGAEAHDPLRQEPLPGTRVERAIVWATDYLRHDATPAIEGAGGDRQTYLVANDVRRRGVSSEAEVLGLMLEHYNERCIPPWEPGEMAKKVRSAFRNGPGRPGCDAPENQFSVYAEASVPTKLELQGEAAVPAGSHPTALELAKLEDDPPAPPFLVEEWLPEGAVTLFSAHGGSGKSHMALGWSVCLAAGRHPFRPESCIPRRRVVFYSSEDGARVLQHRLANLLRAVNVSREDMAGWLCVLDASESDNVLFAGSERDGGKLTARAKWLSDYCRSFGADLLVFDNASDAFDGQENARALVRQFVRSLSRICTTVLLLGHVDAATSMAAAGEGKGYSGSTAWNNSVRSRWAMSSIKPSGDLLLTLAKSNYARAGAEVTLRYDTAAKVFQVVSMATQETREAGIRTVLLDLFAQALDTGLRISPHATTSRSVFNSISEMEGFPRGVKSAEVAREVRRWLAEKLVAIERHRTEDRKSVDRLVLTEAGAAAVRAIREAPAGELFAQT